MTDEHLLCKQFQDRLDRLPLMYGLTIGINAVSRSHVALRLAVTDAQKFKTLDAAVRRQLGDIRALVLHGVPIAGRTAMQRQAVLKKQADDARSICQNLGIPIPCGSDRYANSGASGGQRAAGEIMENVAKLSDAACDAIRSVSSQKRKSGMPRRAATKKTAEALVSSGAVVNAARYWGLNQTTPPAISQALDYLEVVKDEITKAESYCRQAAKSLSDASPVSKTFLWDYAGIGEMEAGFGLPPVKENAVSAHEATEMDRASSASMDSSAVSTAPSELFRELQQSGDLMISDTCRSGHGCGTQSGYELRINKIMRKLECSRHLNDSAPGIACVSVGIGLAAMAVQANLLLPAFAMSVGALTVGKYWAIRSRE